MKKHATKSKVNLATSEQNYLTFCSMQGRTRVISGHTKRQTWLSHPFPSVLSLRNDLALRITQISLFISSRVKGARGERERERRERKRKGDSQEEKKTPRKKEKTTKFPETRSCKNFLRSMQKGWLTRDVAAGKRGGGKLSIRS